MLIKLKSGEIPPKLTPNMKELIQKIDGSSQKEQPEERVKQSSSQMRTSNFFDETQFNNQSQNVVEEKKETKVKNKSSAEFDNFADFGAFGSKKEKSQPPAPPAPERNLRISTSSFENTSNARSPKFPEVPAELQQKPPQIFSIDEGVPQSLYNQVLNELKSIQTNLYPKVQELSNSNRQSNNILEQTNSLLHSFEQTHSSLASRLLELKKNQDDMNYRLNQTCIRMRDVIVRQSDFIAELLQCINQEANMNMDRVEVLENYAG